MAAERRRDPALAPAPVDEFEFYRRQAFGNQSDAEQRRPSATALSRRRTSMVPEVETSLVHESPRRTPEPPIGRSRSAKVASRESSTSGNSLLVPTTNIIGGGEDEHSEEEDRRLAMAYRSSPRHLSLCAARTRSGARRQSESREGRGNKLDVLTPDVVPIRSFATTSHGIVNRGDSMRSSSNSVDDQDDFTPLPTVRRGSMRPPEDHHVPVLSSLPLTVPTQAVAKQQVFYVQILGASGVGKSSLCQQFLTSEYMGDIDPDEVHPPSWDEAICLMRLSVKLDGAEAIIVLLDALPHVEDQEMEVLTEMDAYVVVYGVDDRTSFVFAQNLLAEMLEKRDLTTAVMLVGNKSDLVRTREVDAEQGKSMAKKFRCRFMETSSTLNHGVDELLVDILKDIRARAAYARKPSKADNGDSTISRFFKKMSVRVKKPKHKGKVDN